jgi:hypothetical protein
MHISDNSVLPDDSFPANWIILPLGIPPIPRAKSSDELPVLIMS